VVPASATSDAAWHQAAFDGVNRHHYFQGMINLPTRCTAAGWILCLESRVSIYATLWSIQVQDPAAPFSKPRWVEVTAQAVPAHVGSPTPGCGYEDGDPYARFLPPALETDEDGDAEFHRAVVFITNETHKGTARSSQEYADPLIVLSGKDYSTMTFKDLHRRLEEAIRSGPRVVAEFLGPRGQRRIITSEDIERSSDEERP
jgi:hypothetical protein